MVLISEKKKVVVVMPAYNAESTLEKTYNDIPGEYVDEVILVDDASQDKTVEVAKKLGIDRVIVHQKNKGYGANQKTCYKTALVDNADIIVLLHPDYQYDPKRIPIMIKPIYEGKVDVVYGSRMLVRGNAKKGGMPLYKRVGNFLLTIYINFMLGTDLTDGATGYIAYSRGVLEKISFELNSDGFTFDEEAIIQVAKNNFRITEVPTPTIYEDRSSSISLKKSIRYGITLLFKLIQYKLHQFHIIRCKQFDT